MRRLLGLSQSLLALLVVACSSSSEPGTSSDGGGTAQAGSGGSQLTTAGAPASGGEAGGTSLGGGGASAGTGGSTVAEGGSGGSSAGSGGAIGGSAANNPSGIAGHAGTAGTGAGGASGAGGSSGGAGAAGAAGASSTDCGFEPVTPNATAATHKVLCYLHSIYGNHILSGQEEDNSDAAMNTIVAASGKYPAIRAFDVNNSMAPTQCVQQWNNGGLCMFGYHMGINGNSFNVAANINNVLASGTSENKSFNQDLDRIAQYVQPVQQAGGVAILRLFHEAGKGCNWFWWTMGTSAQWQQLFKYAFNYLTATKGLNNVLWIAPLCGSPDPAYNPGSKYIDFGGADDYVSSGTDYEPLTNLFQQTEATFPNMMVALHECGPIPDPDQLKSSATKWLFFNVWSGEYMTPKWNTTAHVKAVYTNDYVITRDELPSFK
jgi:hypothetical protein